MLNDKFYVYVDYTKEEVPRPFYVGKGNSSRVLSLKRNAKHRGIAKKYGIERRQVFETVCEQEAFKRETELITELHTFVGDPECSDVSCNFTKGGEGIAGINQRTVTQSDQLGNVIATFHSVREAADALGTRSSILSNWFMGKGVLPVKLRQFKFEIASSRLEHKKAQHGNSMTVLEIDPVTNEVTKEHSSITSVLRSIGVSYTTFSRALRTRDPGAMHRLVLKTGKKWAFKDASAHEGRSHAKNCDFATSSKKVIVTNSLGVESSYRSVTRAANELGINVNRLLQCLHASGHIDELNLDCSFSDKSDLQKRITRTKDWLSSLSGVNGISVIKSDEKGNPVAEYGSIAQAEHAEGYKNREVYNGLSMIDEIVLDGFSWKRKAG